MRGDLVAYRALLYATICVCLSGCLTRKEVEAYVWNNTGIAAGVCDKYPILYESGMYRRLDDEVCKKNGKNIPCHEWMSYCAPEMKSNFSITARDLNKILDELTPKEDGK
jgi:hypothetical protein